MTHSSDPIKGQCHCGSVQFSVRLENGLGSGLRCTCSICRMRGAVVVTVPLADFTITKGEELLTLYQFHTKAAQHYFCSRCGIYTHHQRRYDPGQYAVNVACLEGVSPFDFPAVPVMDGNNHPHDVGGALRIAGTMRFEPSD